jgi:hypothetical protein
MKMKIAGRRATLFRQLYATSKSFLLDVSKSLIDGDKFSENQPAQYANDRLSLGINQHGYQSPSASGG